MSWSSWSARLSSLALNLPNVLATTTSEARIGKVLNGFDAELQAQCLSYKILDGRHVLGIQLEGLARVVVHPVPDDMSMVVRFPLMPLKGQKHYDIYKSFALAGRHLAQPLPQGVALG